MAVVPDGVSTEELGSTSTLQLHNTSWRQAGRYECEEPSSRQTKSLDVFIPGHGKNPDTLPADVLHLPQGARGLLSPP